MMKSSPLAVVVMHGY